MGVDIKKCRNGKIEIAQSHLVDTFFSPVDQEENINVKLFQLPNH